MKEKYITHVKFGDFEKKDPCVIDDENCENFKCFEYCKKELSDNDKQLNIKECIKDDLIINDDDNNNFCTQG